MDLPRLERAPGLLADGPIYAAVRAGTAQNFLRQLPLPGEVTRELAQARQDLGFDPLVDDVLERFAIPSDAIISMTLGRPVGAEASQQLTADLEHRDDRFLSLISRVMNEPTSGPEKRLDAPPGDAPGWVETPPLEEKIELPPPLGESLGGLPAPEPAPKLEPIGPAERREIEDLLRKSDAAALQFRVHIPTTDPSRIVEELRTRTGASAGEPLCRDLSTELCVGGGRELLVVRREDAAVVLDILMFTGRSSEGADLATRRAAVREAIEAPPATLAVLDQMAGHASLYVDAEQLVAMTEHERIGSTVRSLSWASGADRAEMVKRRLRRGKHLRRLLAAPRLFDGLLASAYHERDHTQLQVSWPLREGQAALAASSLAPPPVRVPVPSLDALCDGALLCARSRGLPPPERLGTSLGLGIYGDVRALEDALSTTSEVGLVLLLISTWPNALGTLTWHLPLSEARGAEAALLRGALDAVGRVQSLGLSVRRLDVGRRSLQATYAAYARVPSSDIGLVNTALSFAELRMNPTTVEGIDGQVMMLRVPEDDVPAVLMSQLDAEAVKDDEGKEVVHGWLSLVDDPKQLAWLLGLPTDDGAAPFAYAEIPDLWRLVASVPELVDALGFARTWATERAVRMSLGLDGADLQLAMDVQHQG